MSVLTQNSPTPNFLELAALVVPQRRLGLKCGLRKACPFLPMPLCLGWDTDPTGDDSPSEAMVTGLLLSDIASGATRVVEAPWMHALYRHTCEAYSPGTVVMNLREAGYTSKLGMAHTAILGALVVQMFVVLVFMAHGSTREGALLLAAGIIRILEGVFSWKYPAHRSPRTHSQRFLALHTGMTTKHILVIVHGPPGLARCVNLEDAAVPWRAERTRLQVWFRCAIKMSVWLQRGACMATTANSLLIPSVLLMGTAVNELVAACGNVLPSRHSVVLATEDHILDRLAAACQFANTVSIGFVESILPDSDGSHAAYQWISTALDPGSQLGLPKHAEANTVLQSTLKRRRGHRNDSLGEESL
ncbi:hypothetical protein MVEN_02163800 [Mycena venus]|uniref:Uncharacterized protein n=1 Tax=Mycena venus TaxID=2733690 RepID=A0A8H6X8I4_9AGAR|nr:hypothetical protein MVEN_02163800 [Mycena venus]